jgi:hypothetical protein
MALSCQQGAGIYQKFTPVLAEIALSKKYSIQVYIISYLGLHPAHQVVPGVARGPNKAPRRQQRKGPTAEPE